MDLARLLLSARTYGQCDGTTNERNELPPPHSVAHQSWGKRVDYQFLILITGVAASQPAASDDVSVGSRTALAVTSAERQLTLRFRTKSLQRGSRQFRATNGNCAAQQRASLFDHLVGAGEQGWWNGEAERLRSLEIDDQLEFGWLLDRQVARLGAFQNFIHIRRGKAVTVNYSWAVADQGPAPCALRTLGAEGAAAQLRQCRKIRAPMLVDQLAQRGRRQHLHVVAPQIEVPGHFQVPGGREADDQRAVGLILHDLGRVELEAAGVGGGSG